MTTRRAGLPERLGRSRAARVCWWLLIPATGLTGLVIGYFPLWFQMAAGNDRDDYLMSAGGYGAAAGVLWFAVLGVLGLRGPRAVAWTAAGLAVLLSALTAGSALTAAVMPAGPGMLTFGEGAGSVLAMPWTWVLLLAGGTGTYHLWTEHRRTGRSFATTLKRRAWGTERDG